MRIGSRARIVLNTAPDHWLAFQALRMIYRNQARWSEALDATRSLFATLGNQAVVDALSGGGSDDGNRQAMRLAADALATQAETRFVLPTQIAVLYDMADEVDKSVGWLEKAFMARDPDLPYIRHLRIYSGAVMSDPRTAAILEALRFPSSR